MARDPNDFLVIEEAPGNVENYSLTRVDGREMLSTCFEFRLVIRSDGDIPDAKAWIASSITFVMGASDPDYKRRINGCCVRFEHSYQKGAYVEFVIDVAPNFVLARLRRDNKIFLNKTVKEIVAQLLRQHEIVFDDSKVKFVTDKREYCVQHQESDYDFINRLLEEEGVFYYFRYDPGAGRFKHKMYLADDPSGYFDDDQISSLSFRRDHLLKGLESIELSESAATASWITHDYNYKKPKELKPIKVFTTLPWATPNTGVYEWTGGYDNMAAGKRSAKLSMEETEASAVLLEGTGSYLAFTPGARFEIEDERLTPKEKRIAIRSVIHSAWDPYSVDEGGQPTYQQQFTAIPSHQPYRPPHTTPPALIRGPQTAVVMDNVDPEGFGRVKVRFHWDRHEENTCWLRVAQQWAGKAYGAQFIPRIDMEVLVDYLDGDPDRPVITGCLYNGDNEHPFMPPEKLSQSGWRTTSYKEGDVLQELIFEDKEGEEEIYTFAGRNYRRKVVKDEIVEIEETLTKNVKKEAKYEFEDTFDKTVAKDATYDFKETKRETVGNDLILEVKDEIRVKVGKSITIEGRIDGTASANGPLTIESNVSITLKVGGSIVELTPAGVQITGPIVRINS